MKCVERGIVIGGMWREIYVMGGIVRRVLCDGSKWVKFYVM